MSAYNTLIEKELIGRAPEPKVLGIGGSPRKNGNSDVLLDHLLKGVRAEKIATDKIQLRDVRFQPCIGCEQCRKDWICTGLIDGMSLLYPSIVESRGLVLVSPTHNYNITAWMKAFIDRLYCCYSFDDNHPRGWSSRLAGQGRTAVVAAVCEQADSYDMGFTLEAMRRPLEALGYDVIGELPVFGIFEKGGVRERTDLLDAAVKLGRELATSLV